nr:transcription factor [Wicklowia aquatica]
MAVQQSEPEKDMSSGAKKHPKLRSTCDACIAAKIRCSRDMPQCFRCQIYKINCVYSVSRRMGRPRKPRPTSRGGQEQNNKCAGDTDETSKEKPQAGNQTTSTQTKQQDTVPPLASSNQQSNQNEQEISTSGSPSAMPMASDPPPLTMDDNFTTSSDYSLDTMTPPLHDNIYIVSQSPIMDSSGRAHSFSELCSPMDSSYDALFRQKSHDTIRQVQDQLSLITATNGQLDDRSSLWADNKTHDIFSIGNESPTFSNLMDLDTLDFSKPSAPTQLDTQPPLEPSSPDLDRQRPLSFLSPSNQTACQAFKSTNPIPSRCECYKSTLRMLLSLDETLPNATSLTLDTALKLDNDVLVHNTKVLQCTICAGTHSNQLLLQAMLVDRIVGMLESKSSNSTRTTPSQSFSNLKRPTDTHHAHKPSSFRQLSGGSGLPQNETNILTSAENCALRVGGYEVLEEKNSFIKQLLQMRLMSLMAALRSLQKATQGMLQDSSAKLAGMMLVETGLRLRTVVGRVELWNV